MSDSQRFPVAAHALAYLAHKGAHSPAQAVPSAILAASIPTNPVVVRRVTALLAKALTAADQAAGQALSKITIADLLDQDPASLAAFAPHSSCPVAA